MGTSGSEYASNNHHLAVLGLDATATWDRVERSYRSLVSDLTPGPDADHSKVTLAMAMLDEVERAYRSLRVRKVA